MFTSLYRYFFGSQLEFWAFVTSVAGVWLMTRQWLIAWPVGLVSVILTALVCCQSRLFADAGLQIFFAAVLLYGWWHWLHPGPAQPALPVTRLAPAARLPLALATLAMFAVIFLLNTGLKFYLSPGGGAGWRQALATLGLGAILKTTQWGVTAGDSLTTALSLTAQWMQARKQIENWALWIVADVLYIFLYWLKDLNSFAILSVIYCVLAVMGHIEWRRSLRAASGAVPRPAPSAS